MSNGRMLPTGPGLRAGAAASFGATTFSGTVTLSDVNLVLGTATGTKIGTAASQKLGFFNATPVVQSAAYTQTFATGTRTHAARTATTIATADAGIDLTAVVGLTNEIKGKVNALIADLASTAGVVNQILDDHQALGLLA